MANLKEYISGLMEIDNEDNTKRYLMFYFMQIVMDNIANKCS